MPAFVLAHDLGTTGNKATLYDADGRLVSSAFSAYETRFAAHGWAEQDPNAWWAAVCTSTRTLVELANVQPADVACITFSGQMMGAVAVDAHARPLRPAIIWADTRSQEQVAAVAKAIDPAAVYRITGHRLSPSYSLSKILWIREHEPDVFRATHAFLHAKDAMIARMTGAFVTEPSDASGMNLFDLEAGVWSQDILSAAGLPVEKLPRIVRSTDIVGRVLPETADALGLLAGTPVVAGGGDGPCAGVGAGSVREDVVYCYLGSSSWIATAAARPIYDPEQRTFTFGHVIPGLFMPTGTMQAAGASYQWAREQIGDGAGIRSFEQMNVLAEQSPPGANHLLYLPYLLGERSPRWNPDASGAFIGLTMRHTRADLLRAVLEGVAFNLRVILNAFTRQGAQATSVRVIGGGVTAHIWTQIMADILGVPLQRLTLIEEATSMGAAVTGGVGIGLYDSFAMADRMNPVEQTFHPDAACAGRYARLYEAFNAAYDQLMPVYSMLSGDF